MKKLLWPPSAGGTALVVVAVDILQLLLQLGEAIADLAAIEFEIGLAGAGTLLPAAARSAGREATDAWRLSSRWLTSLSTTFCWPVMVVKGVNHLGQQLTPGGGRRSPSAHRRPG